MTIDTIGEAVDRERTRRVLASIISKAEPEEVVEEPVEEPVEPKEPAVPTGGERPKSGYAAPMADKGLRLPKARFTEDKVKGFLTENAAKLARGGNYISVWRDDEKGLVWLDTTKVMDGPQGQAAAARFGGDSNYDLSADKEVGEGSRKLVSFHDMTDEGEIDAITAEIIEAASEEPVAKHTPGGVDHDQGKHGSWSDGQSDDLKSEGSAATEPSGGKQPAAADVPQGKPGVQGLPVGRHSVMQLPDEPPREDDAFVREVHDRYLAQVGPQIQHVAQNAGMDQMSIEGERRGIDTMGMYGEWEGNEFKGFTKDRVQWQAETLAAMEAEQAAANGQLPGTGSKAVVMLGLPGAGKSYLISNQLNEHVDTREYLTINADDIKEKLIYDDTPPEIEGVTGMELSSMVHEESSTMRKAWERTAMTKGTNVIFDITGANGKKTEKLLSNLSDLGYEIQLVHADVSVQEAAASALRRAATGGDLDAGELGRVVPAEFIGGMGVDSGGQGAPLDVIDQNFDDYLPYADRAMWFRTYPLNVEREKGEQKPTELLWSS